MSKIVRSPRVYGDTSPDDEGATTQEALYEEHPALTFLSALGLWACPEGEEFYIVHFPRSGGKPIHTAFTDVIEAYLFVASLGPEPNCYVSMATFPKAPKGKHNRQADKASHLSCEWMDLDVRGPAHPESEIHSKGEALRILRGMQAPPTIVTDTGHGVQAFWCYGSVEDETCLAPVEEVRQTHERFHEYAVRIGSDPKVGDLARIMRVPGTWNSKKALDPCLVRIIDLGEVGQ